MRGLARGVWLAIALLVNACGSQTSPERGVGFGGGGECEECECEGAGESDAGVAAGGGAGGGAGEGADADADDGVGSGECETGDSFCEGQVLYSCMDERWVTDDCRDNGAWGQTCFDPGNGAACGGECAEGRARCSGDNRELCDATGGFDLDRVCSVCVGEGRCADCVPDGPDMCDPDRRYLRSCTVSGRWSTLATDCHALNAPDGYTCLDDRCGGECAEGRGMCNDQTPMICDSTGTYVQNGDSCETPDFYCSDGACVPNPPDDIGNNSGTGEATLGLSNNYIYAQPVLTPDYAVELLGLGIFMTSDSVGGDVYLGLHENVGGEPAALVNSTVRFGPIANDENYNPRTSSLPADIQLTANTLYWIVAYVAKYAGQNPKVYLNQSTAAGSYREGGLEFQSPFSLTTGIGMTAEQYGEISLWMKVQRLL